MYGTYFLMKLTCLTSALSHDDAITALKTARGAIEQSSDRWSNILIGSTAIVAVGVVMEIVAEAMEVRKDLNEGKRFEPFHLIAFIAAAVVALFVAIEGVAELKVASRETDLRENNSAEQQELQVSANDAKQTADNATSEAVALAKRVGGLDALVAQTNGKLDQLTATATDQKTRSDALIASLTKKQKEVDATIEGAKKQVAALAASLSTINNLRQQLHEQGVFRTLTKSQADKLGPFLKEKLQPDPKTQLPALGVGAISDTEAQAYGMQFLKLFKDEGVFVYPTPNGDFPRGIVQLEATKYGLVLAIGPNGADRSHAYEPFIGLLKVMGSVGLEAAIEIDPDLKFGQGQLDIERKPIKE